MNCHCVGQVHVELQNICVNPDAIGVYGRAEANGAIARLRPANFLHPSQCRPTAVRTREARALLAAEPTPG